MKKIFVLGDSISIHYGPYLEQFLNGIMEYDRKGKNGILGNINTMSDMNGGDSSNVLEYILLNPDIEYDVILLNCGLHDIKTVETRQVSEEQYRANLKEVIRIVHERGKKVIWVSTTPVDEEIHNSKCKEFSRFNADVVKYNEIANTVMERFTVPVIDLYKFTTNLGTDLYIDHVHYNLKIRELQAAYLAGAILSLT